VLAVRIAVDAARHGDDVIGDRRQRHKLLDALDFEAVSDGTHLGTDDLQIRPA
jgi:hypothetical protein